MTLGRTGDDAESDIFQITTHRLNGCACRDSGFTLLEVMIAFVIAGLALAVLYHVEVTSLTETRTATRYQEAVSLAKSHMAVALHGGPLLPGDRQGDDGNGFHWRIRITPIEQTAVTPLTGVGPRQPTSIPVVLYAVTIQVTWGEAGSETRREVRLETQQIGELAR